MPSRKKALADPKPGRQVPERSPARRSQPGPRAAKAAALRKLQTEASTRHISKASKTKKLAEGAPSTSRRDQKNREGEADSDFARGSKQTRASLAEQQNALTEKTFREPQELSETSESIRPTTEIAVANPESDITVNAGSSASAETLLWILESRTSEQNWYRRKGYLPSIDDTTLEIVKIVLGTIPALKMARLRAEDKNFAPRLDTERNVCLDPIPGDSYLPEFEELSPKIPENRVAAEVYSRLWAADLENCKGENEAIFQRTIMISLLDRYRLIFGDIEGSDPKGQNDISKRLAFNVEAEWTCDPMPTRALVDKVEKLPFLAAPKPDLCVSFRKEDLIPRALWRLMPPALRKLVCYEGVGPPYNKRAFGFFVVESKKSRYSPEDDVAKSQALNDASQSLHNMFEFFREAGQKKIFFERVRFFSATTSEKGLMIRIHRAEPLKRDSASFEDVGPIPTKPPYNLEFQFEEYKFFPQREFTRENVVDMFAKIMIGYGEGVLHKLLKNAAIEIDRKFKTLREKGILPLQAINDYRHGQKELPSRDTKTPRQSEQLGQGGRGTSTRSNDIARQAAEGRVSEANQAGLTRSSSGSILEGNSVPEDEPPSTGLSQRVENLETGPPAKKPRTSGGGGRGKNTGR